MRSYELLLRFTNKEEDGHQYLVAIYQQPLHRYLIARLYHWYNMRIFKVPGFMALDRWHTKWFCKDLSYIPISARQDIKSYFLARQDKVVLAEFVVDEPTYVKMGGRAVNREA